MRPLNPATRLLALIAFLALASGCGAGDGPQSRGEASPSEERETPTAGGADSTLVATARRVVSFLRGDAPFDERLFADTVVLHVAPEGGGAQRAVRASELARPSGWTVGGYSLLPPADERELVTAVGRHLSCVEAPLATQSEALARLPHVGTSLRPAEGGSCLQAWTLTLVFDTAGVSPRVVAALYDQWEW